MPGRTIQMIRVIERFMMILLGFFAVAIFAGAILIMVDMDRSSVSQGGRYYLAVAAVVVLGFLDGQFQKILKRQIPFSLTTTPKESRYALISLLLLTAAGVVLIGVAWILP
jgi:hypothetical protein